MKRSQDYISKKQYKKCAWKKCILVLMYIFKVFKTFFFFIAWILIAISLLLLWSHYEPVPSQDKPNLPPILLWWTNGFFGTLGPLRCPNSLTCHVTNNKNQYRHINAFMFYGSTINFSDLPLPKKSSHIWGLYHEESPRNVEEFLHEEVLKMFNFSSTFSSYSNVPFPLQYLNSLEDITNTNYYVPTKVKNAMLQDISPILYLQSDCETSTERDLYVKELMKYIPIDSYGECLNNKNLPEIFKTDYLNNLNDEQFLKFAARYKFTVAIENGVCHDYITEKLWRALKLGSVPIYFGAPNIREWLPNQNSAVLLEDFDTVEKMSQHLNDLFLDDTKYEKYLEHKIDKVITNKKLLKEFERNPQANDALKTVVNFECFVCRKIHELQSSSQEVHNVNKSHYNCPKPISALGLQINPKNSWIYSWKQAGYRANKIVNTVQNSKK